MISIGLREPVAPPAPGTGGAVGGRRTRLFRRGLVVVGFAVVVAVLYAAAQHAFAGDSDGATVVLEGQAMGAGHVLLHGWSLSLDSFWSIDAVFYMLVGVITGLHAFALYLVPAAIAALVIVVGGALATDGRRSLSAAAAAATVVALLGLPSHTLSLFFLRGPLHVGTALWCLIAFAGLRSGRFGRGWLMAVVFLAAGILGDFQMVALGVVPVVIAGVVAMLRMRDWRAGMPGVTAGGAAVILAAVVREVADAVGTYSVGTSHPTASLSQMFTNVGHIGTWGAALLGVGNGPFGRGNVPAALQDVHIVGLLVVVSGMATAGVALIRGAWRGQRSAAASTWNLDDLLVLALVSDLVVFVDLTSTNDPDYTRYLTAAVIFGAVLGGRWVGRITARMATMPWRRCVWAGGVAIVAVFAIALGINVSAPRPAPAFDQLGAFLQAHHLDQGVGDYWSASITTVATDGAVTVRPVITTPGGRVVRYDRQSLASWYAGRSFEFLVYDTARPWGGIQSATATATFGAPTHTYAVGSYRVLVWPHPVAMPTTGFVPVPPPSRPSRP